jgi:hypothetical protein
VNDVAKVYIALGLVAFALTPNVQHASAQDNRPYESVSHSNRLLDPERMETIRGTVTNVETVTLQHEAAFVQATVKTGEQTIPVHLGPQWYMEEQIHHFQLKKGQQVEVKGSRNEVEGKSLFIAAEIKTAELEERLRLRHPDGTPVWSGGERVK